MRNLDQLPSVLYPLSLDPSAPRYLEQPPERLAIFLAREVWEDSQESARNDLDSQEASEEAEMSYLVEQWLATLSHQQQENLANALEIVCQGSKELLQTMLPSAQS